MKTVCRIFISTLIFINIASSLLFAQTPKKTTQSEAPKIYVGMPREEIFKSYPVKQRLKDYAKNGLEVIIFDDHLTNEAGDTISFYLKDGKVEWWDKVHPTSKAKKPDEKKIYKGMPKEKLYELYPIKYQTQNYVKEKLEVIMFDDYLTKEKGDYITIYLKDGKVDWWDKVQANVTPEERLKAVINRKNQAQSSSMAAESKASEAQDSTMSTVNYLKRRDRQMGIGDSEIQRYLKNKRQ